MVHKPRPLTRRQRQLLRQFSHCQLAMTPMEFWSKWDVSQRQIAEICRCDVSLVSRWFSPEARGLEPMPYHLWYLALADRWLEFYEQLSPELQRQLHSPPE